MAVSLSASRLPVANGHALRSRAQPFMGASPSSTPLRAQQATVSRPQRRAQQVSAAAESAAPGASSLGEYEAFLSKPLGVKFGRGKDGGAYVTRSDAQLGNTDPRIKAGDKVVKVSASFGSDVWEALSFGQVIYAIKTRNGEVYLRLLDNGGDTSALESDDESEAERLFRLERGGGNARNYEVRKETEAKRRGMFDAALADFRRGKVEQALITFEDVLAMEPKNYLGDNFSRVTQVYRVTQYNVACCYAALSQVEAGLDALKAALAAGFEDFDKVRKDPNLAKLRADERFTAIINAYDEPIFNEGALDAIKSIFSFGKK
eukprot:scaffold6.g2542.t1